MPSTKNGGKIKFGIDFDVNKSGLAQVTRLLQDVQNAASAKGGNGLESQFQRAATAAKQLEQIINGSWNHKLNQLNLNTFNQGLKNAKLDLKTLRNDLAGAGASGQAAFNSLAQSVLNTNVQLKQSKTLLDSMATSMANTVKWGITASIFNNITGSIQQAYYYVKDLDSSLTDIRMVTGAGADEMERFAKNANQISQNLGRSTLDFTKSTVEYYRQGLSDEDVQARTEVTLKAQNITGAGSQMVDYLTAVWNGFQATADEAEGYVDKLALVADSSASDLAELATAMSKVAATANVMGVDIDQLNAQIATVVATTRLAPESVGTAFKTIYSRLNDIKAGADDAEISLGNYSSRMAQLGFNVLDASGHLRDTGDVIEEIGGRWKTLTKEQQTYLASTMGGQRQITQVMALFDNWGTYVDLLNTSLQANGTLNQKNDIYLQSTAAHLEQLSTESERLYDALFDADTLNSLVDTLRGALGIFNDFVEGIGGGTNAFVYFGSVVAGIFSKQIAQGINNAEQAWNRFRANIGSQKAKQDMINAIKSQASQEAFLGNGTVLGDRALQKQAEAVEKTLGIQKNLTIEQQKEINEIQKGIGLTQQKIIQLEQVEEKRKAQVQTAQSLIKIDREDLQRLNSRKQALEETVTSTQKAASAVNNIQWNFLDEGKLKTSGQQMAQILEDAKKDILDLTNEFGYTEEDIDNIIYDLNNGKIDLREWNQLTALINSENNDYVKQLNAVNTLLAKNDIDASKLTEEERKRLAILLKQNDAYAKQGQHVKNTQTLIRGLSAAGQALTSVAGSLPILLDESATSAERMNAAFSGTQGIISSVGTMFGPIGMGISTLTNGALSLIKTIFGDQIERWFMSAEDKINELTERTKKANEEIKNSNQDIASLAGIKDEWKELSALAGSYGKNLNKMTQDQQNRYHELVDMMVGYNSEILVGYDAQGQAIIRNNDELQKTIKLLQQQREQAVMNSLGDIGNIFEDENARITQPFNNIDKYQADIDATQAQINALKEEQQLVDEAFASGELSTTVENFSENINSYFTNLLNNPLYDSYKEQLQNWGLLSLFEELKNSSGNILNMTEEQLKEYSDNFLDLQSQLSDYFSIAEGQDNQWMASNLLANSEGLAYQASIIIGQENSRLQELNEQLKDQQTVLEDAQKAIEENAVKYDANLISTLVQSYSIYNKEWKSVKTDENEAFLHQLIIDYIDSFSYVPGEISDASKGIASNTEDMVRFTREYINSLGESFTAIDEAVQNGVKNIDLNNLKGTTKEKNQQLKNIIQSILDDIKTDPLYQNENNKKALQSYLKNFFDLTNLNIEWAQDGATIQKLQSQAADWIENARQAITNYFTKEGINQGSVDVGGSRITIPVSLSLEQVENIFNEKDLNNIPEIMQHIGKSVQEYFDTDEINNWGDAVAAAYQDFQESEERLSQLQNIDFDSAYGNFDNTVKNLQAGKQLKEDELEYLQILEQENEQLKQLALTRGRGSKEYLNYLNSQKKSGQELYIQTQKNIIAQKQLQKNQTDDEALILQYDQDIANALYNIQRAQKAITEELEQRKQLEEEILKLKLSQAEQDVTQAQKNITNASNLNETIAKMQSPFEELDTSDFETLSFYEGIDKELADLAGSELGGRFSQAYLNRLQELSKNQNSLLSSLYNDQTVALQSEIAAQQQIVNKAQTDYNDAKSKVTEINNLKNILQQINSGTFTEEMAQQAGFDTVEEVAAAAQTAIEGEVQATKNLGEARSKLSTETTNLNNLNLQLIQSQNYLNEQQRIAIASAEEKLNLFNSLTNRDNLNTDEQQQLNLLMDDLIAKYPELSQQANILKDTWLVGTTEYRDALRQVQNTIQELQRAQLESQETNIVSEIQEKLDDAKEEQLILDIDVDPEAWDSFVDDVEDFCGIEHDIILAIHSDAEDAFESLKSQMDQIYNAASKIGEGYKVAADDIREVNNVFPGILENAQILHDGTVQLNQDAVQQAIAGASDTAAADAQSVNQQLEGQAALLRTKAINYRQAADLARQLAQGQLTIESLTADQRATLFEGFANAKQDMSNQAATQEEKDLNAVGTTASQVGGDMASSMAQAATSVVGSFAEMTNQAIQNLQTIARAAEVTKQGGIPSGSGVAGTIGSTYNGGQQSNHSNTTQPSGVTNSISSSASGRIKDVDVQGNVIDHSLEELKADKGWNDVANMFDQLALDADKAANDIQGMMVANAAMTQQAATGLGNVAAGSGISPKTGSGGGGGSKGSSGSDDIKDPDFMEYLEDEADRYHDIDIRIKQLTDDLEDLQKLQDKLAGQDLIDNLNDQLGILEAQNKAYQEKIDIAEGEAAELRDKLAVDQVAFDAEGNIINYAEALGAKLQWVNNTIDYYNSLTAEEQEAYKDTVEAAKQEYEQMKKTIERYDEVTTQLIPQLSDNIRDNLDKEVEIKISRFKMTVDIRLDMSKAQRDWNEFRKEVIDMIRDDDVLGNMNAELRDFASYYNQASTAAVQDLTRQVTATLGQLYQMDAGQDASSYGNNRAQALEDLKKYTDDLMNNLQDVEKLIKDIKQSIFDAIDNVADAMDEQIDNFEFISKLIDHDKKMIELMYGKDAYDSLGKYYELQQENNNKQLDFLKKQRNYWQANMLAEEAAMKKMTLGSNEWAQAKKRFDAYKEQWMKAVEDLNSLTESAIENIIDKYANAIDAVFDKLNKKLTNDKGLEYVKEEWELINKEADRYYDKINRMYETNKFEEAAKDAINANIGNLKAQKSLNDLMNEQLKYLRDKDKLTKYDVDRANALLQIEIKRLALEQSRQAKTKLRLRRDTQGNYTYQYTANQDDINKAQQDFNDAQNDLWNLDVQYKRQLGNDLISLYEEWQQKLAEIDKDITLTAEEQAERRTLINQYYGNIINGILNENLNVRNLMMGDAFDIYGNLYEKNAEDFKKMTDEEKAAFMEDLVPTWNSGVEQMADTMAGEGGFIPATKDAMEELDQATKDYQDSLNETAAAAGVDFADIQMGTDDTITITQDLLDMNQQVIDSYVNELEAVKKVLDQVKQLVTAYQLAKQAAIDAATEAYNYWMKEQSIAAERAEAEAKANEVVQLPYDAPQTYVAATPVLNYNPQPVYSGGGYSGGGYSGGGYSNGGGYSSGSTGNTSANNTSSITKSGTPLKTVTGQWSGGTSTSIHYTNTNPGSSGYTNLNNTDTWIKKVNGKYVSAFGTGGYTGNWNSEGKLAVLHEKELVLNQQDTENILDAVSIVRDLNNWLDSLYDGITAPNISTGTAGAGSNTTIDQNVHITAQFPSVQDHTEIEKALETLVNRASQFAFNTNR